MAQNSKLNWGRLALGGLIAAVICFMTDGFMHEKLLKSDWMALMQANQAKAPEHSNSAFLYFFVYELGRGFLALFVYSLLRTRLKPGPKTAAWSGAVSWFAFCLTGPAQFIPLGYYSCALWLKGAAIQLVTSIAATLAGAAAYKERR